MSESGAGRRQAISAGDNGHGTQQDFELYSMGRMVEPRLTAFEEHLLTCPHCQECVAEEDRCRENIRGAATLWQQQSSPARRVLPRLAWAYAAALLGLIALIVFEWPALQNQMNNQQVTSAVVLLHADRGADPAGFAPARHPLMLEPDLTGLPSLPVYRLEIVNASGRPAFQTDMPSAGSGRGASLPRGLPAGAYFVRLYSARELLREYTLTVGK